MNEQPAVSIVLPVRRAQTTVRDTLRSLLESCAAVPAEVVAVVASEDDTRRELESWSDPHLRVLVTHGRRSVPELRRDGVRAARAPLIAIAEDHCLYPANWLEHHVRVLRDASIDLCGGPVGNRRFSYAGWAQYFTRYSPFIPPGKEGPVRALPGNNGCYRASLFQSHSELIKEGFWEAEFNAELLKNGSRFWYAPELAVWQRQHRGLLEYIPLRYRHGRVYGARRYTAASPAERAAIVRRLPLVPFILFARIGRATLRARKNLGRFILAAPLVFVYAMAWAAGEAAGCFRGAGGAVHDTD